MIHFRGRDYLSVLAYRLLARSRFAHFGRRVRIVFPVRILGARFVTLEDAVTLQYGAFINAISLGGYPPVVRFGRGTMVGNFSHIICTRRIEIGEGVLIADRVFITDTEHDYRDVTRPVIDQPLRHIADVMIGAGSWIGENVCLLGCRIGRQSVIGANSVVTADIPDYCVAAGAPAVPVRRYCHTTKLWRRTTPDGVFAE